MPNILKLSPHQASILADRPECCVEQSLTDQVGTDGVPVDRGAATIDQTGCCQAARVAGRDLHTDQDHLTSRARLTWICSPSSSGRPCWIAGRAAPSTGWRTSGIDDPPAVTDSGDPSSHCTASSRPLALAVPCLVLTVPLDSAHQSHRPVQARSQARQMLEDLEEGSRDHHHRLYSALPQRHRNRSQGEVSMKPSFEIGDRVRFQPPVPAKYLHLDRSDTYGPGTTTGFWGHNNQQATIRWDHPYFSDSRYGGAHIANLHKVKP